MKVPERPEEADADGWWVSVAGTGCQDSEVDAAALRALLDDVAAGARRARRRRGAGCGACPFADLGYARVDHHRALRQGLPEAVYGPGKTPEQCAGIVAELLADGTGPGAAHPGRRRAGQGRPRRPPRRARPAGTTVVWRPLPADHGPSGS